MSNAREIRTLDKALAELHEIAGGQKREYREHAARRKAEGYEHVGGGVYVKGSAEAKADMRRRIREAAGAARATMRNPRARSKRFRTGDRVYFSAKGGGAGRGGVTGAGRRGDYHGFRHMQYPVLYDEHVEPEWTRSEYLWRAETPNPGVGPGRRFHVTKGYVRERLRDPKAFDPRSFRTKDIGKPGGHKLIVGCPKGCWRPRGKPGAQCSVGLEAQAILHPLSEREVLLRTGKCPAGVEVGSRANPRAGGTSDARWTQDPVDPRWWLFGNARIGVVESDRTPRRWAPAYVIDGAPAGATTAYDRQSLRAAMLAAEKRIAAKEG